MNLSEEKRDEADLWALSASARQDAFAAEAGDCFDDFDPTKPDTVCCQNCNKHIPISTYYTRIYGDLIIKWEGFQVAAEDLDASAEFDGGTSADQLQKLGRHYCRSCRESLGISEVHFQGVERLTVDSYIDMEDPFAD